MADTVCWLLLAFLATTALTELICYGSIFNGPREYLDLQSYNRSKPVVAWLAGQLYSLVQCPFCTSFWTSSVILTILHRHLPFSGLEGLVGVLASVTVSNWLLNTIYPRSVKRFSSVQDVLDDIE